MDHDGRREFGPGKVEPPPRSGLSRRRFLSLMGATAALATGTGCPGRGQVAPLTRAVEGTQPGVPGFYASAFQEALSSYSVLVKTREGRPIHIEGNDAHPTSKGKTSLRAIAEVLRLYDPDRLARPLVEGRPVTWADADGRVVPILLEARQRSRPVLLVTGAVRSPSTRALIADLGKALPGMKHVAWEPTVGDGELEALAACFGEVRRARPLPERAHVIVSFEADFLGPDRPEAVAGFVSNRPESALDARMNRLYVFEGGVSLTGAVADHRFRLPPSRAAAVIFALANALHGNGVPLPTSVDPRWLVPFDLERIGRESGAAPGPLMGVVSDLEREQGRSLVMAGTALPGEAHVACHLLNAMLGSEGRTLDASRESPLGLASWRELATVFKDAASGRFAAVVFWGTNPAYTWPDAGLWRSVVAGVAFKATIGSLADETAAVSQVVLPENHWLESWGDHETATDMLCLQQPAIAPLYDTLQAEEILLRWAKALGASVPASYHDHVKTLWRKQVWPSGSPVPFERFWQAALHDGVAGREVPPAPARAFSGGAVAAAARAAADRPAGVLELIAVPAVGVFDGRHANSGWLQELPDPITKLTWGNGALVSPADASRYGLTDGDLVRLETRGAATDLPVVVQPGQAPGVVTVAMGYGRRTGAVARGVGASVFPLLDAGSGSPHLRYGVALSPLGRRVPLPFAQRHGRLEGRDIVRHFSLADDADKLRRLTAHPVAELASLYPDQKYPEHKWGMAIDLTRCTGCSTCVIACQSENNIACVGPEQVVKGREMHWMRIDRYYEGGVDNPWVLFQPMLCQQCDNAPCETVCPVYATNHSTDGLNQMVYNRCVGTRYCGNNCPYRVRRFNFLEFTASKREPESLVFNPEVTVRPRGVMEKCTFCIQRIQDARQRAKVEGRTLGDGEIVPACAAACPARAIVFGDLKDPSSRVARLSLDERGYKVLEELGAKPSVTYLARISNSLGGRG
ncbi:MAG: 4Fe-4S dicluster domain-containing protein [Candidatus Riflebacteria bacterium]|nr:4Fe-4S dicluster domain-containing protein [Candidatus Riflebacteria bacterium]